MEKEEAINLIDTLGANYIRDDFMISKYDQKKKEYINPAFEQDIKEINDKGINIIGILNHHKTDKILEDDHIISTEQELELFNEFSKNINAKFPYVKLFEVNLLVSASTSLYQLTNIWALPKHIIVKIAI